MGLCLQIVSKFFFYTQSIRRMPKKVMSESRKLAMTMCPMNKVPYKKSGKFTSKLGEPLCRRKPAKKRAMKGAMPMAHAMPMTHAMPMAHAMPTHYNPYLPTLRLR